MFSVLHKNTNRDLLVVGINSSCQKKRYKFILGPSQPDEDDYGFVSETSSQLYNKLIQKMYSTPSEDQPKFAPSRKPNGSNLLNTKVRRQCFSSASVNILLILF